jgi:hypothetical protein
MRDDSLCAVILQPGYLPWIGFFDQMNSADVFVIYDDVQYTKHDWRSRNKIKTEAGIKWLSVPVLTKGRHGQLINEAEIKDRRLWQRKHVGSMQYAYSKAPYFKDHFPALKAILQNGHKLLMDLNMDLIRYIKNALNISSRIVYSSELKIDGEKTERLVEICKALGTNSYLTGDAAVNYLDIEQFKKNGIAVEFHQYSHPEYPQLHGEFIPYLSIIDLLFNCGPKSKDYLSLEED